MKLRPGRRRPLIGVTCASDSLWLAWKCCQLAVWLAGGRAMKITATNDASYTECDGIILSGGNDIDPALYGQENLASVHIDAARDALEEKVARWALAQHKPVLGICRGAQMMNIVLDGDLHQSARDFYEDFIPTDSTLGKILARRQVTFTAEGLLAEIFEGRETVWVNSLHHQAVARLGHGLQAVAYDDHGIVQALEGASLAHLMIGVQWHPEYMLYRAAQRRIFRVLVQASAMSGEPGFSVGQS